MEMYKYLMFLIFPSKKKAVEDYAPLSEGQEAHWEVANCPAVFFLFLTYLI